MRQRGFSLVEIAIVLVIISLILLAVLNSQGLIGSAKAKDVVTIVNDLRTATTLFKNRYNYLPGDLPLPSGELAGITNVGNGDGKIDGTMDAQGVVLVSSEAEAVPAQLYAAGLIGKINNNRITTDYGSVTLVSSETADGLVSGFAAANTLTRNAIIFYNMPCDVVTEVDNKIDDGNSAAGRARGTACTNNFIQWYAVAL